MKQFAWFSDRAFLKSFIPTQHNLVEFMKFSTMVFTGALLFYPFFLQAPFLGWDWFFFFNLNNPDYNLLSPASAYPPYTRFFIQCLTWLDWRQSLAFLNALTVMAVVLATWKNGGRFFSVLLVLLSPPIWMLMWIGHVEGIVLFGLVSNFIPLALIKPQLTIWGLLNSPHRMIWTILFLGITLILWPMWPLRMVGATMTHEAAFGWAVTGWPILILGILLILGAGTNQYRLIAAGLLISPYLMPYNLVILLPVIGQVRGYRKVIIWAATWCLMFGTGVGGWAKYLNLAFPIAAFFLSLSFSEYIDNVKALVRRLKFFPNPLSRQVN